MNIKVLLDGLEWKPVPEQTAPPDGIPTVTHEGQLTLGNVTITVLQLSDGNRIIPEAEMHRLLNQEPP